MNEDLQRVKKKLDQHVLDFLAQRIATGERTFKNDDLEEFCRKAVQECGGRCTYGSPARVMRDLQEKKRKVRYTLLSRSDSLYRVDFVAAEQLEMFAA